MNKKPDNKILAGLPEAQLARLLPLLKPLALSRGQSLSENGATGRFIYFPETSVISCFASMEDGKSAEVGMVGFEGVVDVTSLLGSRQPRQSLSVSIPGRALRANKEDFAREIFRGDGVQHAILEYTAQYVAQVSQRSACAVLHRLEQRFAIWLLLLADRLDGDVIQITHERIAEHLGVRRAGITVIAANMEAAGAIACSRGRLRIIDRAKLEAMACECYGALALRRQPDVSVEATAPL
jgi:CRP-like cAMP-binding protein